MSDFVVRNVEVKDLADIIQLCHEERWSINENMLLSIWKMDASGWFVAERDGEIIGKGSTTFIIIIIIEVMI